MDRSVEKLLVDHERCAQEQVHIIGYVQPHGLLFALSEPDLIIRRVSENIFAMVGISPETVLGGSIEAVLGAPQFETFRTNVQSGEPPTSTLIRLPFSDGGLEMTCTARRQDGALIVELEPLGGAYSIRPLNVDAHIQNPFSRMELASDILDLSRLAASEVRKLSGFARVMVYRFDETWNGEVIAEEVGPGIESYLGYRFPASDIPPQVRQLLLVNPLRAIADVNAIPVPIISEIGPFTERSLDLTYSALRGTSPIHLEYLRNMGVQSSLTISIVVEHQLWGMIACHHPSPRRVDWRTGSVCKLIGQFFSAQAALRNNNFALKSRLRSGALLESYMAGIESSNAVLDGEHFQSAPLLELMEADGLLTSIDGVASSHGVTVKEKSLLPVIRKLQTLSTRGIASSNVLGSLDPSAAVYASRASGALYIGLTDEGDDYLLLLRRELVETITWAGNPAKSVTTDEHDQLHPRASFAAWRETVRGRSRPWNDLELESARFLREQLCRLREAHRLRESEKSVQHFADHLAESQSQLQAVFDKMREGVVVLDKEYTVVQINKSAADLLGLKETKMMSIEGIRSSIELCLPDGSLLPREEWPGARSLAGNFIQHTEVLIRRRDTGRIIHAEISSAPILNDVDEMVQVVVCIRDITESKQVDLAQARLAAIVESSEDAIIGKDNLGYVTSWNTAAEKIFGYTSSEMIGQSIKRLLPPELEQEEDQILCRINKGETVEHFETKRKRKDGSIIDVSLTISPIKNAGGKVIGASKIARDITEKRRTESQLQQSQKLEAIGQLTGGVAHDFNNLLGVILGNLDLLERRILNDEPALKRVQTAQKAATRGADLTRRLLAFSREDELRPTSTLLNDAVRNVIELASRGLGPEITIATNLDESMQPVFVDVARLESALLNLVVNARDAMPNGGSLNITTESRNLEENYAPVQAGEIRAGRYASISVSDSGSGMSGEVLARALEPFFTTKERGKGSGLGLAMVYGFVKQSGGMIRIYSETGLGTTVTFYLPFAERRVRPVSPSAKKAPSRGSTVSVLVVDDEIDLLEVAVAYLQDLGCSTFEAKDGATAFEIIMSHSEIGLVVTDIVMPGGMNGVELARKIRQFRPEISIIYCSGFPAGALAERTMPPIDGPLLHKPYRRAEFDAIVCQALGKAIERPAR